MYEKERMKASEKMEKLKESRDDLNASSRPLHEKVKHHEAALAEAEEELNALQSGASGIRVKEQEQMMLDAEFNIAHDRASELELEVKDLRSQLDVEVQEKAHLEASVTEVTARITEVNRELEGEVGPLFEQAHAAQRSAASTLSETQQRANALGALAGRHSQFKSAAARDAWIGGELETLEDMVAAKESAVSRMRATKTKIGAAIGASETSIVQCAATLLAKESELRTANADFSTAERELDMLMETRKDLWRKEGDMKKQSDQQNEEEKKWQSKFDRTRPRHTTMAMQSLNRIMDEARSRREPWVNEVHGPLLELFDLDSSKFTTAVELTASNALFNVVVDTEATATKIIKLLRKKKGGRLTFMPLDRCV